MTQEETFTVLATRLPGMSDQDLFLEIVDACKKYGIDARTLLQHRPIKDVRIGDSLAVIPRIDGPDHSAVPYFAKLLLCLSVASEKQEHALGDFEERLNKLWIPQFGPRMGRLVCVWWAARSMAGILRFGIIAALVDRIVSNLHSR
jgi:hypothetical protein